MKLATAHEMRFCLRPKPRILLSRAPAPPPRPCYQFRFVFRGASVPIDQYGGVQTTGRDNYYRGAGFPMKCDPNSAYPESDGALLCYPRRAYRGACTGPTILKAPRRCFGVTGRLEFVCVCARAHVCARVFVDDPPPPDLPRPDLPKPCRCPLPLCRPVACALQVQGRIRRRGAAVLEAVPQQVQVVRLVLRAPGACGVPVDSCRTPRSWPGTPETPCTRADPNRQGISPLDASHVALSSSHGAVTSATPRPRPPPAQDLPIGCGAFAGAIYKNCDGVSAVGLDGNATSGASSLYDDGWGVLADMQEGEVREFTGQSGTTYTVKHTGLDADWAGPKSFAAAVGAFPLYNNFAAEAGDGAPPPRAAAADVGVQLNVTAGNSTSPGCQGSLGCYCDRVADGTTFADPFNVSFRNYIVCYSGYAIQTSCDAVSAYNATSGECAVYLPALIEWEKTMCANLPNGFYPRHKADGSTEIIECVNGTMLVPCKEGWVRAGPDNTTCVDPTTLVSAERALADAAAARMQQVQAAYNATLLKNASSIACAGSDNCFCKARPPARCVREAGMAGRRGGAQDVFGEEPGKDARAPRRILHRAPRPPSPCACPLVLPRRTPTNRTQPVLAPAHPPPQGKPDGLYATNEASQYSSVIASWTASTAPGRKKKKSKPPKIVPKTLPTAGADSQILNAAGALASYIQCSNGVGDVKACPAGELFNPTLRVCQDAGVLAPGTSTAAPAGCKSASCACANRRDGLFPSPQRARGKKGSQSAVVCYGQQAAAMTCPGTSAVQQVQDGAYACIAATNDTSKPNGNALAAAQAAAAQTSSGSGGSGGGGGVLSTAPTLLPAASSAGDSAAAQSGTGSGSGPGPSTSAPSNTASSSAADNGNFFGEGRGRVRRAPPLAARCRHGPRAPNLGLCVVHCPCRALLRNPLRRGRAALQLEPYRSQPRRSRLPTPLACRTVCWRWRRSLGDAGVRPATPPANQSARGGGGCHPALAIFARTSGRAGDRRSAAQLGPGGGPPRVTRSRALEAPVFRRVRGPLGAVAAHACLCECYRT
jgi:hypothetical protein